MPKKQIRNSFYFYMLDFKEEQRKKGVNYANMQEVSLAAGSSWTTAPPGLRAKYEAMAKAEKAKNNIPENKYTSQGVPLSVLEQQAREVREAEEAERQDIKNFVKLKSFNRTSILSEDIYLMDVNCYCKAGPRYIIGEMTILRFNLTDGIIDRYHEMINTGDIPVGYALDIKLGAEEFGLEVPDPDGTRSNLMQILANIIDYLKQKDRKVKSLPAIFTMPDKVAPILDFIQDMCLRAGEDDSLFRIYKLDTLFFTLINNIKTQSNEGFPKESLALAQLTKDCFKYTPGLGCEHHEVSDKSIECTTSRAKRWAYTILDSCCPIVGIDLQPGKHVPGDYDVDSILIYKEQKLERAGPTSRVAGSTVASSSCDTSLGNDTLNDSATTASLGLLVKKEKRKHTPLRMPKTDYSQVIRAPPELTEDQFPKLTGAGRGRGLAGSSSKMNSGK